ncbi:MAG: hypothetical protein ACYC8T_38920 [Myxococcaceae bacterium]
MVVSLVVALVLGTPSTPQPVDPINDAWVGRYRWFEVSAYSDDAGIPQRALIAQYRTDPGSYGGAGLEEDAGVAYYLAPQPLFSPDGSRWCWRARYVNTAGLASPFGPEACFRTDRTSPANPTGLDAGPSTGTGAVSFSFTPATDAHSGVEGYTLITGPTAQGPWYEWIDRIEPGPPLPAVFGPGTWYAWVFAADFAWNDNHADWPHEVVSFQVTASPAVPTPPAPRWGEPATNGWGTTLHYDADWARDAGVTHLVASFCDVDAGCTWRLAYHDEPAGSSAQWLQPEDEGFYRGRVAAVRGGEVGNWSAPSGAMVIDRTPPGLTPGAVLATPALSRAGPVQVSWPAATDGLSGVAGYRIEENNLTTSGSRIVTSAGPAVAVSGMAEGRLRYRVRARDVVDNESGWSAYSAAVVVDSTGPSSLPPAAQVAGAGAVLVSWSLPTDLLSSVTLVELERTAEDAGTAIEPVTGTSRVEALPPGRYQWRLRGTDAVSNVGSFSAYSSAVTLDADGGVVIDPDAGVIEPDAGPPDPQDPRRLAAGCGCQSPGGSELLWLIVLLAFVPSARRGSLRASRLSSSV